MRVSAGSREMGRPPGILGALWVVVGHEKRKVSEGLGSVGERKSGSIFSQSVT